jgi:hypothetical protein
MEKSMTLSYGQLAGAAVAALLPLLGQAQNSATPAQSHPQVLTTAHQDELASLAALTPHKMNPAFQEPAHDRRRVPYADPVSFAGDAVVQSAHHAAPAAATTAGLNFDGVGQDFPGFAVQWAPPDTTAAVGATQVVEWVNGSFAIFNKATGASVYGPATGDTLFTGFGGACETSNDGDPVVLYDKAAQRWVLMQFAVPTGGPYYQCIAVSKTSDATGGYYRYSFQYSGFNDYPKGSVWPDAYYLTYNMFTPSVFAGAQACAMDRAKMLSGLPATQVCFQLDKAYGSLLPADLDGATLPPAGSPNYMLNLGTSSLNLWKFHADFATPANSTLSAPTNIPVAPFAAACGGGSCIPQAGTHNQLDSLADRAMFRLAYRNFGDHEALVVNHAVMIGTKKNASYTGTRWYELRNLATAPTVYQQASYAPDNTSRWMGSAAMDKMGNIALGFSTSSDVLKPGIRYVTRLAGDPLGVMSNETTVVQGGGAQTGTLNRWGDYSQMSIDPVDDCTFWYANEYIKADGKYNWSTRMTSFKVAGCK